MVAQAVRQLPNSVRIWSKASDLETELKAKKRVFRKGWLIRDFCLYYLINICVNVWDFLFNLKMTALRKMTSNITYPKNL